MATVDSGIETLFSDDSPCELRSPEDIEVTECQLYAPNRPPNIQPYSGVLEKGRVVIRPIAFKPTGMSPSTRFGLEGERYGSTPILTRSGSTDHHHRQFMIPNSNYSLDRKLRSSCQSVNSSPPLALSSLTSLPNQLINYNSLESVSKSPVSTTGSTLTNKSSYRLSCGGVGSLLDLTPSPSDSGVSELEAALRDRDSELTYLRQTMEHNEQVIFRVYQEKEKVWERELRRIKSVHDNRLRASAQKALKLEQMLMMQTYQLQQDKKRLCLESQKANSESDRLKQEVNLLRERLEETEWSLCQKTGEISLLKSQLKDSQNDQNLKGHELLQLRNDFRDVKEQLDLQEMEKTGIRRILNEKDEEIDKLKQNVLKLTNLKLDNEEPRSLPFRETQTQQYNCDFDKYYNDKLEKVHHINIKSKENEIQGLIADCCLTYTSSRCLEVTKLKEEIESKRKKFEEERLIWAHEKEKVLKYQRQLQLNYVQMYRRTKALESKIESLTIELEFDKTGIKKKPIQTEITQTIEL